MTFEELMAETDKALGKKPKRTPSTTDRPASETTPVPRARALYNHAAPGQPEDMRDYPPPEAGHLERDKSADNLSAYDRAHIGAVRALMGKEAGQSDADVLMAFRKSRDATVPDDEVIAKDGKGALTVGDVRKTEKAMSDARLITLGSMIGGPVVGAVSKPLGGVVGPMTATGLGATAAAAATQAASDTVDPSVTAADIPGRTAKAGVAGGTAAAVIGLGNAAVKPLADKIVVPNKERDMYDWLPPEKRPQLPSVDAEATAQKFDEAAKKIASGAGILGSAAGGVAGGATAYLGTRQAARALADYAVAVSEGKATEPMVKALLSMGFPQATIDGVTKTSKPVSVGKE